MGGGERGRAKRNGEGKSEGYSEGAKSKVSWSMHGVGVSRKKVTEPASVQWRPLTAQ